MSITLTNPTVIPAISIDKARITSLNINFYKDGIHLEDCSVFVAWDKGYGDDETFTKVTQDNTILTAQQMLSVLVTAQAITNPEQLIEGVSTPMDQICQALIIKLQEYGKM